MELVLLTKIFVSYSHEDGAFASRLAEELRSYDIGTWIDKLEMRAGDPLFEKISRGIAESDFLIVILSPNSVNSKWVRREVYSALAKEVSSEQIRVVPVLYSQCEVPPLICDKIWADFRRSFSDGLADLLRGICRDKEVFKYMMNSRSILNPDSEAIEQAVSFLIKNDASKEFLFVHGDNGFAIELQTIWLTDKELKEKGFPDSFMNSSTRVKRVIPFLMKNYSLILPKYISTAFKYLGRDVGTNRLISQSIGTLTKKLFLLMARRVLTYCIRDRVEGMQSVDGKNLLEEAEKVSKSVSPTARSFSAYVFECNPDDMFYLGLAGCKDSMKSGNRIYDVKVVVPRNAVPNDTVREYLGKIYPLPPDPEIFVFQWIMYFMPEIAYEHIVKCSYSGQLITKHLNRVGLRKSDYYHFGYE